MHGRCSHVKGLSHSQGTAVSQHTMAGGMREREREREKANDHSNGLHSQQLPGTRSQNSLNNDNRDEEEKITSGPELAPVPTCTCMCLCFCMQTDR